MCPIHLLSHPQGRGTQNFETRIFSADSEPCTLYVSFLSFEYRPEICALYVFDACVWSESATINCRSWKLSTSSVSGPTSSQINTKRRNSVCLLASYLEINASSPDKGNENGQPLDMSKKKDGAWRPMATLRSDSRLLSLTIDAG
jgi:hypothetical protein